MDFCIDYVIILLIGTLRKYRILSFKWDSAEHGIPCHGITRKQNSVRIEQNSKTNCDGIPGGNSYVQTP